MNSKAVITVVGKDMVGIIHKVSGKLLDYNVNILEINQAVVDDYFTMILIADVTGIDEKFDEFKKDLEKIGAEMGQTIMIQHEDIFNAMHNV